MSGMDRLTDEALNFWTGSPVDQIRDMARELLAHRRAKRSITNCDFYLKGSKYKNGPFSIVTCDPSGATHFDMDDLVVMSRSEYSRRASQASPAPSDGLREENERLRGEIAIMAAALDDVETGARISTNGNVWRFWQRELAKHHDRRRTERSALPPAPEQE